MAVQTGTTYTFTSNIAYDYQCSHCGARNSGTDKLQKSVFTSVLIRVNPREEADNYFSHRLDSLNKGEIPDRYSDIALPCRCASCNHEEPWAKRVPKFPSPHWLWFMLITFFIAIIRDPGPLNYVILFSGSIPYLALVIRCAVKRSKRLKAIAALPAESLPTVRFAPRSNSFF